jgi:hypothetical protein
MNKIQDETGRCGVLWSKLLLSFSFTTSASRKDRLSQFLQVMRLTFKRKDLKSLINSNPSICFVGKTLAKMTAFPWRHLGHMYLSTLIGLTSPWRTSLKKLFPSCRPLAAAAFLLFFFLFVDDARRRPLRS